MSLYRRATKLELAEPNDYLMVNRLYPAAEGEGTTIGQAKWFLRFQGCSIGCKWCDSKETWRFDGIVEDWSTANNHMMFRLHEKDFDNFVKDMRERFPLLHHVSITGGEPLQQNPILLKKLIDKMIDNSYVIQVETSGQITLNQDEETRKAMTNVMRNNGLISIDFKTPSSGLDANVTAIKHFLGVRQSAVQVKAVIADDDDYNAAKKHYNELMVEYPAAEYILTPCWTPGKQHALAKDANAFFEKLFNDTEWHCLPKVILQQHKVMFGTDNLDS